MLSDRLSFIGSTGGFGNCYSTANSVLSSMNESKSQLFSDFENVSIHLEDETDLYIPKQEEMTPNRRNTMTGFFK